MVTNAANRVVRQLTAAEGYLELGLPQTALRELQAIEDPGHLAVPLLWLKGEALRANGQFEEAIEPLRMAVQSLPLPLLKQAWASLADCLKQTGRTEELRDIAELGISERVEPPVVESQSPAEASSETILPRATPPLLTVEIPSFGTLSVTFEPGQSLTIQIERKA